ncbi:YggS family pyridoxal phosphate-dependent enzyme [bacterium]|nr:YggS family pyridoxal phosphate-dependent enzyme [bacterium]
MNIAKNASLKYKNLIKELQPFLAERNVKVIFVTKYIESVMMKEIYNEGISIFGENRVQAISDKVASLPSDIEWHFIGHLQRNKVKALPPVKLIHSVESLKLVSELEKTGKKKNQIFDILLEINTGGEKAKNGLFEEADIEEMMELIAKSDYVQAHGFMTMAPFTDDNNIVRNCFRKLKKLRDKYSKYGYTELSMGMTNDYQIALEEGATILRIGSYFFKDD